jgi:hypothetical protein
MVCAPGHTPASQLLLSEFCPRTPPSYYVPHRQRQLHLDAQPSYSANRTTDSVEIYNRTKWIQLRLPSSSSRSPVSLAEPVREIPNFPSKTAQRPNEGIHHERMQADGENRFPRWCHPVPCRVHGRPDPFHHPQRQGPRYLPTLIHSPYERETNTQIVRENDILCLLESEREARRLR